MNQIDMLWTSKQNSNLEGNQGGGGDESLNQDSQKTNNTYILFSLFIMVIWRTEQI